jgi:hypothetical protein
MIIEMVDEMIDCDGPVIIGNLTFYRSDIVKRLDPVAYREMCIDMADTHIEDLKSDLEYLIESDIDGEHYDEIDDLKSRIRELESI